MEENKNEQNGKRARIYDGIKISERGRDIIVLTLAALLCASFVIAIALAK